MFVNYLKGVNCINSCCFENENIKISLFADNLEFIKCANERLMHHFPKGINKLMCTAINVYACSSEHIKHNLYNMASSCCKWKRTKHMKGYYFNGKVDENYNITIWISDIQKRQEFLGVEEVIEAFNHNRTSVIIDDGKNYYFFYAELSDSSVVTPMRLIRSLFMENISTSYDNSLYFHAACFTYKKKGILLCGASGNGKTSTLLDFMKTCDGELVANDKVFLYVDENIGLVSYGWPTVVTIGVGNLKQYKELEKFLWNIEEISCSQELYGYKPNREYLNYTDEQLKNLPKIGNKLVISHEKLATLFNKSILPKSKIDVIINVDHEWDYPKNEITLLLNDDKKKFIDSNIITNISDQLEWLGHDFCPSKKLESIEEYICEKVDVYNFKADFRNIDLKKILEVVI